MRDGTFHFYVQNFSKKYLYHMLGQNSCENKFEYLNRPFCRILFTIGFIPSFTMMIIPLMVIWLNHSVNRIIWWWFTHIIWSRVRRTWWARICPVISSPLKSCSASSTKISSTSVTSHRLFLFHWWVIYCVVINKWVIIFLLNSQHSEKWNPNNQRKSQNEWR